MQKVFGLLTNPEKNLDTLNPEKLYSGEIFSFLWMTAEVVSGGTIFY